MVVTLDDGRIIDTEEDLSKIYLYANDGDDPTPNIRVSVGVFDEIKVTLIEAITDAADAHQGNDEKLRRLIGTLEKGCGILCERLGLPALDSISLPP
jgi:hypothetical protein